MTASPQRMLKTAVCDSNAAVVRELLHKNPELKTTIDQPLPDLSFGIHAIYAAVQRSDRETIDALLAAGADINKRTEWWAGGFGVLDDCDPAMLPFLMERGARLDAHSAARLGKVAELEAMVAADPAVVHARGGDGQTPLHFACSREVASFLVNHGAHVNARDIDHESTPAQYMLRVTQRRHYPGDRQDVARFLLSQGAESEILMAAALGDADMVRSHLCRDPACIRMNVSDEWFPKRDPRAGGSIYIWVLGQKRGPHAVARDFDHEDVFQLLLERTPTELKLAIACELGDETTFYELLSKRANLVATLSEDEKRKLPDAAQNNNTKAVQLMLEAGWPVNTRGDMGATALHWAAYNGNAEMTTEILRHKPDLELKSRDHESAALAWAIFGSGNGWQRETSNFPATVEALQQAGAHVPLDAKRLNPSPAVLQLLYA